MVLSLAPLGKNGMNISAWLGSAATTLSRRSFGTRLMPIVDHCVVQAWGCSWYNRGCATWMRSRKDGNVGDCKTSIVLFAEAAARNSRLSPPGGNTSIRRRYFVQVPFSSQSWTLYNLCFETHGTFRHPGFTIPH